MSGDTLAARNSNGRWLWGDEVTVTKPTATRIDIVTVDFIEQPDGSILPVEEAGFIEPTVSGIKAADVVRPRTQNHVLKVNFVDVQQGDGAVIESPDGKVILVDGGDNQLFARYLAARFRGTTEANPKAIDCILVTHGDADHFAGLPESSSPRPTRQAKAAVHPAEAVLPQRPGQAPGHQDRQECAGRRTARARRARSGTRRFSPAWKTTC